jgi:hypothetical protein
MPDRLPNPGTADPREALKNFWAERRALACAAKAGLDFTGAVRPPRAAEEREWLTEQAIAGGPSVVRENIATLDQPPGPRRRKD